MTVWRWENGKTEPGFADMERLAEVLRVPVSWFFGAGEAEATPLLARQLAAVTTRMEELTRAHGELAAQVARLVLAAPGALAPVLLKPALRVQEVELDEVVSRKRKVKREGT